MNVNHRWGRVLLNLFVGVAALVLMSSSQASARSYTIHTKDGWISRIGPLRINEGPGPTLARATDTFGSASRIDPVGNGANGCHVEWRTLRLQAIFSNFGIGSACAPSVGLLQAATIRSRRFRTVRGVRVGSSSSAIPKKHHNAEFREGAWWIASVYLPYGDGGDVPTIKAIIQRHRVSAIKLFIGAAGD